MRLFDSISLVSICLMLFGASAIGQDLHFSQPYNAPLWMNPATLGEHEGNIGANAIYKNQWRGIDNGFNTILASADASFYKTKDKGFASTGLMVFRDQAGIIALNTTSVHGALAYHLPVGVGQLMAAGVQLGYVSKSIDPSKFEWQNQYDGVSVDKSLSSRETMAFNNEHYLDVNAGLSWVLEPVMTKNIISIGVSGYHLNRPSQNMFDQADRLDPRFTVHSRAELWSSANAKYAFIPSIVAHFQGVSKELVVGGMWKQRYGEDSKYTGEIINNTLELGIFYRVGDAIIPAIAFNLKKSVSFRMCYDVNLSRLTPATSGRGGIEFGLIFTGLSFAQPAIKVEDGKPEKDG